MLKKSYSSPWERLRALLILPVVAFTILLSSSVKAEETDNSQMPGIGVSKDGTVTINGKEIGKKPTDGQQADDDAIYRDANVRLGVEMIADGQEIATDNIKYNLDDETFMVVEDQPEFPGGTAGLLEYLRRNIRYPNECREKNIQGRVLVTFIVNKDGSIVESEVIKSVDPLLDAEALRVVNAMPAWKPGTQKGKPVRVKYTIPVNFRLSVEEKPAE